ncbi:hypothetical protein [Pseudobacteriovorax antillogorgiicola]|uniref:Receptor L domain-containing protein n=1 Tax=Pseudobacteriovorax antillogorgiicola TaxID=1513793 RepID=A0A1Y6CHH8_9BACT|nr:hypothetical protein [Pseudobacteriovorax antillogorgiicola]TCS46960.1 hypothetical protein EDD56_12255 [Pseudobacteriovorax antillogorgiicola]SMF64557.1 hypothetical protein SAMN06296036_12255 [Pseudobacteriovorax antillogorgiicola]
MKSSPFLICLLLAMFISHCGVKKASNQLNQKQLTCKLPDGAEPTHYTPTNLFEILDISKFKSTQILIDGTPKRVSISPSGCINTFRINQVKLENESLLILPEQKAFSRYRSSKKEILFEVYNSDDRITLNSPRRHFKAGETIPFLNGPFTVETRYCLERLGSDSCQEEPLWQNSELEEFSNNVQVQPEWEGSFRIHILSQDSFGIVKQDSFDVDFNSSMPSLDVDFKYFSPSLTYNGIMVREINPNYKIGFSTNRPLETMNIEYCIEDYLVPEELRTCEWQDFDPFDPKTIENGWGRVKYRGQDIFGNESIESSEHYIVRKKCTYEELEATDQYCTDIKGPVNLGSFGGGNPSWKLEQVISIQGKLFLTGVSTSNRDLFKNLRSVTSLEIFSSFYGEKDLSIFSSLEEVLNNVTISSNFTLESLKGLDQIKSIGGKIEVTYNMALKSLEGIEQLESIGQELHITQHDQVTNFNFPNLKSVPKIKVSGNVGLVSAKFPILDKSIEIELADNESFKDLSIPNLKALEVLLISRNSSLTRFSGLESLETIFRDFIVAENQKLVSLSLPKLSYIFKLEALNNSRLIELLGDNRYSSLGIITVKQNPKLCGPHQKSYWQINSDFVFDSEDNCTQP